MNPQQPWRDLPPVLISPRMTLREVQASDAPALLEMFSVPEVGQYLPPTPPTVDAFKRFARWAHRERRAGRFICLVALQRHTGALVGVFQIWSVDPTFATAEWGIAIARPFWGHGLFREAAALVVDFAMDTLGVQRLEARIADGNDRGAAALSGLGAVREGVLRHCFQCGDRLLDHVMWAILRTDWKRHHAA